MFWIRLCDNEDNDCLISECYLNNLDLIELECGLYSVEISLASDLIPREYKLSVAAYKENGMAYDSLESVGKFKVLRYNPENKFNYNWEKPYGYVLDQSKWKINKMS